jgi:8-oxo-dGTP diphosphatase
MSHTRVVVDLHLVLRSEDKILMGLRRNTGFCDGMFHLPAGHLESGETFLQGMVREAKEELSIEVAEKDLSLVHVLHHSTGRIALFFETTKWRGGITNHEPDKCEALCWFLPDDLPDNIIPYARAALKMIRDGQLVGTFGWTCLEPRETIPGLAPVQPIVSEPRRGNPPEAA